MVCLLACSQHESVYDAVASYFVEQRGCTRQEVTSSTGPVVALLVAAQAHQHRPKQLLLLQLAGLSDGSAARSLPEGAWVFVQELLLCTARLQGASWQTFVKVGGCEPRKNWFNEGWARGDDLHRGICLAHIWWSLIRA